MDERPSDTPETNKRTGLSSDMLLIVPVHETVLFPGVIFPISVGRESSVAAVQQAVREQKQIGIVMQRDANVAEPRGEELHRVGTVANIVRYMTAPDGGHHVVVQGVQRFRILDIVQNGYPLHTRWPRGGGGALVTMRRCSR